MTKMKKQDLAKIMQTAWQFVKRNGMTLSDALRTAWRNFKLLTLMRVRIVKFYFQKVDGTIREAFGTLSERLIPATQGEDNRRRSDTVQVYYDTEKQGYRCFKKANLMNIVC